MSLQELGSQAYQKAVFADYNGAVQILDKAIAKFPKDEKLWNNRCFCLLKLNNFKRALQDAENMVKLFPQYPKAHYRNAEALAAVKRFTEAEHSLNYLLKLDPNCAEAQRLLCQVQSQNKVRRVSNLAAMDSSRAVKGSQKGSDLYYSDEDLNKMLERAVALESQNKPSKKKKKKGLF
ncbi:unnamed protein product [Bemisia tabaci]|uniref:Uncharacterized protein n=1 Tax=Bemisia tabaci TaxID=7038 RepID=A0A9P0CDY6_BEMTA|nr:PREDICTED: protein STIP1 homolog isoform X2 [Bemisia tabaci]CAH0777936.1 unnamed protein product [Bemisia tabaci]